MASARIVVRGRVQGVGFRFFVMTRARALGLTGEVWNRRDGAVEMVVYGPEASLFALEEALSQGPGEPVEVSVAPGPSSDPPPDMSIGVTR